MTAKLEALSEREKKTLRLLLEGHDAKSIARNLGLSVHTVNERLRASRRKLEVSSSREAARLLAQSEKGTLKSLVGIEIGVAEDAEDVNNDARHPGRIGVAHPVALALGGTIIMSLIIAAAMLTWTASETTKPGPLPNWSTARAVPEGLLNTLRLDGNRWLWNGDETSQAVVRDYLGVVIQLTPNR